MTSVPDPILGEIKETFGRVAYTHKTQEKDAELKVNAARRIKITNLIIIGVTAAAAVVAPLLQSSVAAWTAAVAAVIASVFAALQLSFDPAAEATSHRVAAKAYLALRNEYRTLLADIHAGAVSVDKVRTRRDALARELAHLDSTAPQTSRKAYAAARAALRGAEALTFDDDEYRKLLDG